MKTLKLKSNDIELEVREATCNFCGEEEKECVVTAFPMFVKYDRYDIDTVPSHICKDCITQLAKLIK